MKSTNDVLLRVLNAALAHYALSLTARSCLRSAAVALVLLLVFAPSRANAVTAQDNGYYVTETSVAFKGLPLCNAPDCTAYSGTQVAQVPTAYYEVPQMVDIIGAQDGEVYKWQVLKPDGTTQTLNTLTYTALNQCFTWDTGNSACNTGGHTIAWDGPIVTCGQTGSWTETVLDNGATAASHQFSLSRSSTGPIVITSPMNPQLFDLNQQNYTATSPIPFSATTSDGSSVNWTAVQDYQTSGHFGYNTHTLNFTSASGQPQNETYQSQGGRVQVTANETVADGGTVQDCVTFYIDGVDGTQITPSLITGQLDSLYPGSYSYMQSLNDGTATMNLMTGVAYLESQYRQFTSVLDSAPIRDPDLYSLYAQYGIVAQWPEESQEDNGSHIGLMMVPTTNVGWEWNWQNNTAEGVTIFSGGSPTSDDKVQDAVRFEGDIVNGNKTLKLPAHIGLASPLSGMQRENNALVLYRGVGLGPTTADTLNELYYIAVCPSPGTYKTTSKGLQCTVGNWQWVVNSSGQPTGVSYANTVRQDLK